jgi:ParB/RepB/Spo0J family partition protein
MEEINVKEIVQKENSRAVYHPEELNQLMGSMQEHGLLEPIGVRKVGRKYEVVFGNRRLMAAAKLGWAKIPAILIDADDKKAQIFNLIENIQRKDITTAEEGRAFNSLKEMGLQESEIAARVGVALSRVKNAIAVYKNVPEELQKKVVPTLAGAKKGQVTASTAVFISELVKDGDLPKAKAKEVYEKAMQDGFSADNVRLLGRLVKKGIDVDEAIELADQVKAVGVTVMVNKYHAQKLEKKYGKAIGTIVYEKLMSDSELKLIRSRRTRADRSAKAKKLSKTRSVLAS